MDHNIERELINSNAHDVNDQQHGNRRRHRHRDHHTHQRSVDDNRYVSSRNNTMDNQSRRSISNNRDYLSDDEYRNSRSRYNGRQRHRRINWHDRYQSVNNNRAQFCNNDAFERQRRHHNRNRSVPAHFQTTDLPVILANSNQRSLLSGSLNYHETPMMSGALNSNHNSDYDMPDFGNMESIDRSELFLTRGNLRSSSPPIVNYGRKPQLIDDRFVTSSNEYSSNEGSTSRYIPYRRQFHELDANRSAVELDSRPVEPVELQGRAIIDLGDLHNRLSNLNSGQRSRLLMSIPEIGVNNQSLTNLDEHTRRRCVDWIIEDSISDPRDHSTEVLVPSESMLGRIKLGFNSIESKLENVYVKYRDKGKRQILWNIWERHNSNYGTYQEFKNSWDSNMSVRHEIWEGIKSNMNRDTGGNIIRAHDLNNELKSDLKKELRSDLREDIRSDVMKDVSRMFDERRPFDRR